MCVSSKELGTLSTFQGEKKGLQIWTCLSASIAEGVSRDNSSGCSSVLLCLAIPAVLQYQPMRRKLTFPKMALSLSDEDKFPFKNPQWAAANAEIKVPSGENTELKRPPF